MQSSPARPKGFRYPTAVIAQAVYLYHRFTLSFRDVQELLFQRGVDISHETIRAWCGRFGPEFAEGLRRREVLRGQTWHLDEMRIVLAGEVHWLWRAINENGEVLEVRLQRHRSADAAVRFFGRLLDEYPLPEVIVTDQLASDAAALRGVPDLAGVPHVQVRAAARQNNRIEQSHRPTRDQERQQRRFRDRQGTQRFLVTHARLSNLFQNIRARTPAKQRRNNLTAGLAVWDEVTRQAV